MPREWGRNRPKGSRKEYFSSDKTHFRELKLEATTDESSRSVELSFSSANGIRQYDWWNGEWYNEILNDSPRAVVLDHLREIGVELFNHNTDKVILNGRTGGI